MSGRPAALALGPFLAELSRRLDALGPAGVRAAIEQQAAALRPSERADFLALFEPIGEPAATAALDVDVDDFAAMVRRLPPASPWRGRERWDDDDDYDDFEDEQTGAESLYGEDLLVAIGERFLGGDVAWAAGAYERVFDVLRSTVDDDRGLDLTVDRALGSEARNRLLWALGTTVSDPGEAADRMVAALQRTEFNADEPTLADLQTARPGGEPIGEPVLRAFADALIVDVTTRPAWQSGRRLRLALAIRAALDGVDAVVEGARAGETPRLATYGWVVDHLIEAGEEQRAAELGEEALAAESRSYDLAELADTVASLWRRLDQPDKALSAQCRSWACRPTVVCLERVLDAAEAADQEGVPAAVDDHPASNHFLQVSVHVLAGRIDQAVTPPTGPDNNLSRDQNAGTRLAIVTACHTSGGGELAPATADALTYLCQRAEMAGWFDLRRRADTWSPTQLADRLAVALAAAPTDPERIVAARLLVDRLAERVLGAKDRPAYSVVAAMVVLLAVAANSVDGTPATTVIDEFDTRYRRFAAFRAELREARVAAGIAAP